MDNQLTPEQLRDWREQTGKSQEEFGEMLDQSRATIARWESASGAVPGWVGLARDGWLARQGHSLDAQIRVIVREEIDAHIERTERPERFEFGQIFYRRDFPLRIAEPTAINDDGLFAKVQITQGGNLLAQRDVNLKQFLERWALAGLALD